VNRKDILDRLLTEEKFLKDVDLMGPRGQVDERKSEKLHEVAGFTAIIARYLKRFPLKKDSVAVLECSCGKSYLGFVLALLIPEICNIPVRLVGVDFNPVLIDRCRSIAEDLRLEGTDFFCDKVISFSPGFKMDIVVSLHACDTATDEALVQGIRSGADFVHAVPCCQNQIKGQIKSGHLLEALTGYGPARYRMANLLTDSLRAEFMKAAGYHVEMDEIGSPKLTPKNLCISARKVRSKTRLPRDSGYRGLRDFFGVKPAIEKMCPEVVTGEGKSI